MCRRQQSKPTHLTEGPKIVTELFDSIVNGNLALGQQGLERQLAHFRETTCLCEGKPLLLEQCQSEFLL